MALPFSQCPDQYGDEQHQRFLNLLKEFEFVPRRIPLNPQLSFSWHAHHSSPVKPHPSGELTSDSLLDEAALGSSTGLDRGCRIRRLRCTGSAAAIEVFSMLSSSNLRKSVTFRCVVRTCFSILTEHRKLVRTRACSRG